MRIISALMSIMLVLGSFAPVFADVEHTPDANSLWVEDFEPFESAADSRAGWFGFEPVEITAEQAGPAVRFREVSQYAGGSIQRILPLSGAEFRYLQVRVTAVEQPEHYLKAWLRLAEEGNPQLGRLEPGITTVDLGRFAFLETLEEMPLNLAVIGPDGRTPSGAVDVDWLRLVKSPLGGLTVELEEAAPADGIAQIGDTLRFRYTADAATEGAVTVICRLADGTPIRLSDQEEVPLTDAGDGTFTGQVAITPEGTELAAQAGTVIASAEVGGEPRNVSLPFAITIAPAPWLAAQAAERVTLGEALLREDFAASDAHDWRAWSDGWSVNRPEEGAGTVGLSNSTYDAPLTDGHWIALPTAPTADASLSAGLRPAGGSGPIMLALRFTDPRNHYRLRVEGANVAIDRVRAGWQEVLAQTTLAEAVRRAADQPAAVATFTAAGPLLVASVDGVPVLHAYDSTLASGRAALGLNRLNGQFEQVELRAASAQVAAEGFAGAGLRLTVGLRERDSSFGRDAGNVAVPVSVENATAGPVGTFDLRATLIRQSLYEDPLAEVEVPEIAAGESASLRIPIAAEQFRAGSYTLVLRLASEGETLATEAVALTIGEPVPEERMDVMWWGSANLAEQVRAVADAGVTIIHEASQRTPELRALGTLLGLQYYSYPPGLAKAPEELREGFVNPQGSSRALRLDELDPAVREWALETARSHANRWRSDPRMRLVLLNTEYEGHSYPNLSAEAEARYREALGFARPEQAIGPYMPASVSLQQFPDRIIPDDSELYRWYRLFYAEGGGALNGLTVEQSREINRIAPRITTFHDPVLRAPQFHGRWDGMELLNHWTYVERNPLDVAAFADELSCLGKRSSWEQQISQMIQVIAYADRAMPGVGPDAPEYLRDAPFVAIPPDIITESVWLAVSRPVDMIAFHGLNTAIETQEQESYRYTNPHTLTALGRVTEALIEPYGPALRKIKERPGPRVALLLSGANTVFGSIMEGGGTQSLHGPLTAARFGVDVLYDEDVRDGALAGYSVLAIPQCRFLLASVREAIAQFQQAGGTVLLDGDAQIRISGAVVLPQVSSEDAPTRQLELVPGEVLELADSPRARLDADLRLTAEALREQLLPRMAERPLVDSTHPYVVLEMRRSGELDYIFAINDRREAGPYLGQFGAVLERGVPIEPTIRLRETPGALYDAIARNPLELAAGEAGGASVQVQLEPGWGKLLVAAPEAIGRPEVTVAEGATVGGAAELTVQARYASGRSIGGVVPLRVELTSPDGARNDYSRYTATDADGSWRLSIPIARNEPAGRWSVRVTELIGGNAAVASFEVQ